MSLIDLETALEKAELEYKLITKHITAKTQDQDSLKLENTAVVIIEIRDAIKLLKALNGISTPQSSQERQTSPESLSVQATAILNYLKTRADSTVYDIATFTKFKLSDVREILRILERKKKIIGVALDKNKGLHLKYWNAI